MAKKGRIKIELRSTESTHWYNTEKNPKKNTGKTGKLTLRKYDPIVRKHVLYEEGKIRK